MGGNPTLAVEHNDPGLLFFLFLIFSVNDTLDDLFEDSGDEEESQDIVNQVLDEIGIEISGKVRAMCFAHGWDLNKFINSMYITTRFYFIFF